ncbi:MAG: UDP-2,3-diacylglucosamine diphosphatase LpxI [Alphaproteobacteria bacterium]|nr:UDP-2,3-diacylglucosamine diphosphatase LpxI [Alphaproteobacteria bacterium]
MAKLGIIAGGGPLPRQIADRILKRGQDVFIIAFEGYTDPETTNGRDHAWVRLGAVGKTIKTLKVENVVDLVLAGPIKRPSLKDLRPDVAALKLLHKFGKKAFGDDGLLTSILSTLEDEGFRILGADELMGTVLVEPGVVAGNTPDAQALLDIERGVAVLRALGAVDVGQAAIVQEGLVLGVEAIEGTDALISRCGELRREGPGGVLVKIRKPDQDTRVDLPTIGVETVLCAARAGLRGIAIEAAGTMIMDRDAVIKKSQEVNVFIFAITVKP